MIKQFYREIYKNYKSQISYRAVRWRSKEKTQEKPPTQDCYIFYIVLRMTPQFELLLQLWKSSDNAFFLQLISGFIFD